MLTIKVGNRDGIPQSSKTIVKPYSLLDDMGLVKRDHQNKAITVKIGQ